MFFVKFRKSAGGNLLMLSKRATGNSWLTEKIYYRQDLMDRMGTLPYTAIL
jgi:hypothetical protein